MARQSELADRIIEEMKLHQQQSQLPQRSPHRLPSLIPSGDGGAILIPDGVAEAISEFGRIFHSSAADLPATFSAADVGQLVQRAFGSTLVGLDLEDDAVANGETLLSGVSSFLDKALAQARSDRTFVLGCWLIRDVAIDAHIGPLRIEPRNSWLSRMQSEGRVSEITARRLRQHWSGSKPRRRVPSKDAMWEDNLREIIGPCPDVCTVQVSGLAPDVAEKKAVLAARLALTAISLLWDRPSKALEGFGLRWDGGARHHHNVSFGPDGWRGSSSRTTRFRGGTWVVTQHWDPAWRENAWLIGPVGELLRAYLAPAQAPERPRAMRTLFHALWWFYEGCEAEVPLMATVKFAAALDALAQGEGQQAILQLIKARLERAPDEGITRDGRTAAAVVREIYSAGRSKTIHGSNDQYSHDWSNTRNLAESLTRHCLVEAIGWLHVNPTADDLRQLRN